MSRKTRDKVFICGGEEYAGARGTALQRSECPNERRHAPMPTLYGAWHAVAELRVKAGQRSLRCSGCGLYALAKGGRDVPGWPRQMRRLVEAAA